MFLVRIIMADFLSWPFINFIFKLLGITEKNGKIPSQKSQEKPVMGENVRHTIDKDYVSGLRHYMKDFGTIPQNTTSYQKIEKISNLMNGYVGDLVSDVRAAMLERVLKIKDAFGKPGVAIGHVSGRELFLGLYPAGAVKSKGWNMFLTINPNPKEALYFKELKEDLSKKRNVAWRTYKAWRFKAYAKKIASVHSAKNWFTNLMRRYFRPWSINTLAQHYYFKNLWQDILKKATDPERQDQIRKIILRFSKKITALEEQGVTPMQIHKERAPYRLPLSADLKMRSTRGNKTVSSKYMFGVLSNHLSYRDLKKMAILKHTADPYNHLKDTDYVESVVYMIDRMQKMRFKSQSLQGPAFNISAPTSYKEPISQKPINKYLTRARMLHHLKEFERVLIPDNEQLYRLLSTTGVEAIQFDFSSNQYVERTSEKTFIENTIIASKKKSKTGRAILVIKNLTSETDNHAFKMAQKHGLETVILTSRQKLGGIKIPDDVTGLKKLGKVRMTDTDEQLNDLVKHLPVKKFIFDENQ
jgi:hypothetical protein